MHLDPTKITGLVLAGGRGMRMGGVDKGLQMLGDMPLAAHALTRLAPQTGAMLISANRHADRYAELAAPYRAAVYADAVLPNVPDFPGPLAGLLTGLRHASTPWVACVPCDTPGFPHDLVEQLAQAVTAASTKAACAVTVDATSGAPSPHPVFALVHVALADDLAAFLQAGERRVRAWYARHTAAEAVFTDERAFYNVNSLQELADLQR